MALLAGTFAALQHRNYRLFFAGQLISLIGTWMQSLALSWLVYQLTNSAFLLGVVGMIGTLPLIFFSIPGGVLADRLEKRRIVLFTQSCAMLFAFILSILTGAGVIRVWEILVIAALGGMVFSLDMPARQAFVVEMVGKEDLMNAIALNSSIFNGARIIGPAIAGILVASVGIGWCFFFNGLSFLAVIAGLLLMRFPARLQEAHTSGMLEDALSGLRYLRSNRTVFRIAVLVGLFSIFAFSYAILLPIFARDVLHSGVKGFGYLMTSSGVGALIGALIVASLARYPHRWRLFLGGALLMAAALFCFSFSRSFPLSAFLLALVGLGGVVLMSSANTMLQLAVPDEMRGRIMGIWGLVFMGTTPLSSFLAGTLAHLLGAPHAVALTASITGLVVLGVIGMRYRGREQRGQE